MLQREGVCVCVTKRERVCACVCYLERERECVRASLRMCVYVCVGGVSGGLVGRGGFCVCGCGCVCVGVFF